MSTEPLVCFTNCHLLIHGETLPQDLYFSPVTGLITPNYYYRDDNVVRVDLNGLCVAPGFLDLQTNGMNNVHFTNLADTSSSDHEHDETKLSRIARMEVRHGVTGFWATLPTVARHRWKQILPMLKPRPFERGAELLGAHVEGPYLCAERKGAHAEEYFIKPDEQDASPEKVYGAENLWEEDAIAANVDDEMSARRAGTVKMLTLAPEMPGAIALIGHLREENPDLRVSLGHSNASYEQGLAGLEMGAIMLTHCFNAMGPMKHREPSLAGLMSTGRCWYSIIADGIHVHPAVCSMAFRTNPSKCILITDSIELAGMEDGVYPSNGQIKHKQEKRGNRVTIQGTDTLIGSCCTIDEVVRNMVAFSGCSLAESVRCVTENVAEMMGESKRGVLEPGRRADFVLLTADGEVKETWIGGRTVWKGE